MCIRDSLHGVGALWRDAKDRPFLHTRRRKSRCTPVRRVPARFPAAEPAGRRQWLRSRVHHVPRLLHHADPARDAQGHDDLAVDQSADRGPARLGLRLRDRRRSARVDPRPARRLQSLCRSGSAVGMTAMMTAVARHVPLLLAWIVALFLVAPLAIIVPMSFSKAVSF